MKWFSRRFTFVFIPNADHSVRQFRIPALILILAPMLILSIAICSAVFIYLFTDRTDRIHELQLRLSATETEQAKQLQLKHKQIVALQADLLELSDQAKSVERQIADINELELQLKTLAGIETKSPTVRISSFTTEAGGQGGEEFELSNVSYYSADEFAAAAKRSYSNISEQLTALKPSLEATKEAIIQHQSILNVTPTIWPTDSRRVTSLFGARKDPFTGRSTYHNGLDIGGNTGDPIYAAADGVVTLSERNYPQGHNIMIDHGRGIATRYMHLSSRSVEVGEQVVKGQQIGKLGSTGRSTGPHLHYEVFVNSTNVNPMSYMTEDRKEP